MPSYAWSRSRFRACGDSPLFSCRENLRRYGVPLLGRDRRAVDDHEQQTSAVLMLPDGTMYGLLTVNASTAGSDHALWMVNPLNRSSPVDGGVAPPRARARSGSSSPAIR